MFSTPGDPKHPHMPSVMLCHSDREGKPYSVELNLYEELDSNLSLGGETHPRQHDPRTLRTNFGDFQMALIRTQKPRFPPVFVAGHSCFLFSYYGKSLCPWLTIRALLGQHNDHIMEIIHLLEVVLSLSITVKSITLGLEYVLCFLWAMPFGCCGFCSVFFRPRKKTGHAVWISNSGMGKRLFRGL